MNALLSKTIIATSLVSLLAGCGSGDSYSPAQKTSNVAPTHGGDIVKNFTEKDAFNMVYLLGTPSGAKSGEGVAIDTDGDALTVTNLTANVEDLTGIEVDGIRVGIRPTALASQLDTGDMHTVILNYDISDGTDSVARTLTVNISGEDAAPVFENLEATFTKFETQAVVDLLEGVTDADGESLTISDFVADAGNAVDAFNQEGSQLTVNIADFADQIELGQTMALTFHYKVNDHNHSLDRSVVVKVRGVKSEPLPPEIVSTFSAELGTNDAPQIVDLANEAYTVEWNGDPIIVKFDTITPTNGGPALKFNKSQGTTLVVDPIDFAPYIANVGDSQTFDYSFTITDGDEGATAGHQVETSFSVTITKQAPVNLIANGSFEDGLTDWTADAGVVAVVDSADAWQGAKELTSSGWSELTSSSFEAKPGASYLVSYAEQMSDWGRYVLKITGGETEISRSFGLHPTFAGPWVDYAIRSVSFETGINELTTNRAVKFETTFNKLDDVKVTRYSADHLNNLVYTGVGSAAVNFEDGTLGTWSAADATQVQVTNNADEVISGNYSLVVSGPASVVLPAGSIKNGKKYLLKTDIKQLEWNQAWGNIIMFQVLDASTWTPFYNNPMEHPRSIDLLNHPIGEVTTFQQIIDPSKTGQIADWTDLPVAIEINPTVWGAPGKVVIDNIQLIEIE